MVNVEAGANVLDKGSQATHKRRGQDEDETALQVLKMSLALYAIVPARHERARG
jgi:hypothetical protein